MTTDPTPLQERIRAAMHEADPDILPCEQSRATAVLPIIAAEVRKAQADAWDEGYGKGSSPYPFVQHNPYREQED